uniref:Uncharacterized protein n=1 Tax=Anguilla anguilla TaxID=7936 RepID=A0A0E9T3K8_ANGAN
MSSMRWTSAVPSSSTPKEMMTMLGSYLATSLVPASMW